MKWMQWALNGKGKADLASTFHLTGVDHKNKRDIKLIKDLKLNRAGSILPLLSQIVILLIDIMYIILFATTTVSTWQKSIRKKLKQKGGVEVEDLVYFQQVSLKVHWPMRKVCKGCCIGGREDCIL
jgi:hypothetical protein